MEARPLPDRRPLRRTVVAVAIVLAVVLSTVGYVVWLRWFRPYTVAELERMIAECPTLVDLCKLDPGSTITLAGTVARARILNTTLGPYTALWLDAGQIPVMYPGDIRSRFPAGAAVSLPLVIKVFRYNGFDFRSADEYPYPGAPLQVGSIITAVSFAGGLGIEPGGGGPGSLRVRVAAHRGESFPLGMFRLSLVDVQGPLYIGETGYLGGSVRDEIEGWSPMGNGTSPLGWITFTDVAGNGLMDLGDEISVRGNRTASPSEFDSRLLLVGGSGILFGVHYWYETSRGMMGWADLDAADLRWVGLGPDSFSPGPPETVDRFRVLGAARTIGPIGDCRFLLRNDFGPVLEEGPLAVGPFLSSGGFTGTITDADGDGRFSAGDGLEIRGATLGGRYRFEVVAESGLVATLDWISGFGMFTGRFPLVEFSNETRLNATSIEAGARVAGGFPIEEARNFTLRLREGAVQVLAMDPTAGSATASGITMTYLPGGDPVLLDGGDRIRLEGLRPGLVYSVEVLHEPSSATSGVWTFTN